MKKDAKTISRIIAISGLFFLVVLAVNLYLCLVGCHDFNGYEGKYPGLFSVAINSIPNTTGSIMHEVTEQPVLQILEEDDYGRVLFCYSEETGRYNEGMRETSPHGGVNLVICQKVDEQFAYYYRDVNYITAPLAEGNEILLYGHVKQAKITDPYNGMTDNEIAQLKEQNNWGKELDLEKCNKVKIVRKIEL